MMNVIYFILGFFGLCLLVYMISKIQMKAWIHVIEEHFDTKLFDNYLNKTKIKKDDTEKE